MEEMAYEFGSAVILLTFMGIIIRCFIEIAQMVCWVT